MGGRDQPCSGQADRRRLRRQPGEVTEAARAIAAEHGGRVALESSPAGTVASLRLPRV